MTVRELSVRKQILIVRQYRQIGITPKLEGYYLPTGEGLKPRFYNGRSKNELDEV